MFRAYNKNRGYEAYQNRVNRGYEAYQNRVNRGYEAYQNRVNGYTNITGVAIITKERNHMQRWVIVDENYLSYLRAHEERIPISDYGENKFKPFFGILFECDDLLYVTQISHAQPRHQNLKNSLDFYKIYLPEKGSNLDRLVAVVNLNYMFPVPKSAISSLDYKNIQNHRTFTSDKEKSLYIDLLQKEMIQINNIGIEEKAIRLYDLKCNFPNSKISNRCLDFKDLESHAHKYSGGH